MSASATWGSRATQNPKTRRLYITYIYIYNNDYSLRVTDRTCTAGCPINRSVGRTIITGGMYTGNGHTQALYNRRQEFYSLVYDTTDGTHRLHTTNGPAYRNALRCYLLWQLYELLLLLCSLMTDMYFNGFCFHSFCNVPRRQTCWCMWASLYYKYTLLLLHELGNLIFVS